MEEVLLASTFRYSAAAAEREFTAGRSLYAVRCAVGSMRRNACRNACACACAWRCEDTASSSFLSRFTVELSSERAAASLSKILVRSFVVVDVVWRAIVSCSLQRFGRVTGEGPGAGQP